jgi:hypothetical protein
MDYSIGARMKFLLISLLLSFNVKAGLPPTQLKGANEPNFATTFNFNVGAFPVSRTGTTITLGTLPVSGGGTGLTSLTQYSLLSGSGTAVNQIVPAASGTLLFATDTFPAFRSLTSLDVTNALGFLPTVSGSVVQSVSATSPVVITGTASNPIISLAYNPVASVSAVSPISITGGASNPVISLQTSGVTSGASFTRLFVDGYGRVTSGSQLTFNEISPLTTNGDILYHNGVSSTRLPIGVSGVVLTSNASGTLEWRQPEQKENINYLTNPSFETGDFTGWTFTGGTGTVSAYVGPIKGNAFVSILSGSPASFCQTAPIPAGNIGQDIEVGGFYKYLTNATTPSLYPLRFRATLNTGGTVSQSVIADISATDTQLYKPVPLMFIGTTSATTSVTFCAELASGTVTTGAYPAEGVPWLDRLYVGTVKNLKNGAIVGPTQTQQVITFGATTTAPTKGTTTSDYIEYTRRGSRMFFKYVYRQTSAVSAGSGDYLISLPTGMRFASNVPFYTGSSVPATEANAYALGTGEISDGTNNGYVFVIPFNATQFKLGQVTNAARSMFTSSANVNFGGAFGLSFEFEVNIDGLQASGVTFDSVCPNDISCTNEFSATVNSAGAILSQSISGWLANCSFGAGLYTCNFGSGVFTTAPTCVATDAEAGGSTALYIVPTATGFTSQFSGGGTNAFTVVCQKNGADFVAKRTIEGYLSKTVTTSGLYLERMVRGKFGGASETTACSASPCTILRQSGEISSVTRASAGQFTLNFAASTFSAPPVCVFNASNNGASALIVNEAANTTSGTFAIFVYNQAAALNDAYVNFECHGPR